LASAKDVLMALKIINKIFYLYIKKECPESATFPPVLLLGFKKADLRRQLLRHPLTEFFEYYLA
jgi:hypothetical protein